MVRGCLPAVTALLGTPVAHPPFWMPEVRDARRSGRVGPVPPPPPSVRFGPAGAAAGSPGPARRPPASEVAGPGAGARVAHLVRAAHPADGGETPQPHLLRLPP